MSLQSHCVICSGMGRCSMQYGVVYCQKQEEDLGPRVESMGSTYDHLKCGRKVTKEERPLYDTEHADQPAKSRLLLSSVMNQSSVTQLILALLCCTANTIARQIMTTYTRTHTQESLRNNLFIYMIRPSNILGVSIVYELQGDRQIM